MKSLFPLGCCLSLVLIGCSGSGGSSKSGLYNPGMGPFDENGDYVEALADAPVRKNNFSRNSSKTKPVPKVAQAKAVPKKPQPQPQPRIVAQAKPRASSPPSPTSPVQSRSTPVARPAPPQPVLMKPAKPAPLKHRVTSSDTLYGLGRKYGVTVSAIQRANGLSGTTIATGRTLLIPR